MEIELNKHIGQTSTIMRVLTSKDNDLSSAFAKIIGNDINGTPLKDIIINNHTVHANKGKINGQLPLEPIFLGFARTFKKITKNLGFHITFKIKLIYKILFILHCQMLQIYK